MCCTLRNINYFIMLQLFFSELFDWQVYSAEESSAFNPFDEALRQHGGKDDMGTWTANRGPVTDSAKAEADKFIGSGRTKKGRKKTRTTLQFISRPHYCDYLAKPCLHAYVTGKICARTIDYRYQTFDNYCMMEYVNCREGYEIWQIVYTGACFNVLPVTDYMHYVYHDDAFLDNYYILDDKMNSK